MTKTVIIEDEKLAGRALVQSLSRIAPDVQVDALLASVAESIAYFSSSPEVDIIFSDVQLADGHSFEIFKEVSIKAPVVFTTAYDEFMLNAFTCNGIDYLLKPVDEKELEEALDKYRRLEKHFNSHTAAMQRLVQYGSSKKKTRLVVKRGLEYISLKLDEIVLFYTENKLVFVTDMNGKKYVAENNLSDLEEMLDGDQFFRVNRQYIVNIDYIRGYKPFEKVKLLVELNRPELNHHIVISQENSQLFRKWMYNA
ncbi:MAG: response regulator transcription factor [Chitinophagaceae bacterium]|nr:response regulator transcription factor [Chitinophagaceae bacterium]